MIHQEGGTRIKHIRCFVVLLCLLFSACTPNAGNLSALPRTETNRAILAPQALSLLAGTATYTLPRSGDMTGTAYEIDLTGDGVPETISCLLRSRNGEMCPCVEIYTHDGGNASLAVRIVGDGNHIDAVYFPELDADGTRGIVIVWGLSGSSLHGVTAGLLSNDNYRTLYHGSCQFLSVADMDRDGYDEILSVTHQTGAAADQVILLDYTEDELQAVASVPLSQGMDLQKVVAANVGFDRIALLCEGYIANYGYMTDVILYSSGALYNVYRSELTGVSDATARDLPIWCADANGDGIVELPIPREASGSSEHQTVASATLIDWCRCGENTELEVLFTTYQDNEEGWAFRFPDQLRTNLLPVRSVNAEGVSATLFYFLSGEGEIGQPLWEIYTLSGDNAAETERSSGLQRLAVADGKIYALRIYEIIHSSFYSEKTLRTLFSVISSVDTTEEATSQ